MVLSLMAQTSTNKSMQRSQSMNLLAQTRPATSNVAGTVRMSSSWTTFIEHPYRTHELGRPLTSKLTNGSSSRLTQPKTPTRQRHSAKQNMSVAKRVSIQRLNNGGISQTSPGSEHKRLSLYTVSSSSLPGNRSEDPVEPRSILKHGNRRYSASYGEIAKGALLRHGSFPAPEVTSPNSQTRTPLSSDAKKLRDELADVSSEEAALRKCNYRLGLTLTSFSDAKKVTFEDDVFVISK